jgi:EXLDI family protein
MSEMKQYDLERTKGRSVKFEGEEIAEAGGQWRHGKEQNRWTTLTLYRTKAGKYVLAKDYYTQWQGEQNDHQVTVCQDAHAVLAALCSGEADYALPENPDEELGELESELLREAAKADSAFSKTAVEEVD